MISYKQRLNPITTFMFDVDGVLTTGDVILYKNDLVRTMNSKDAYAMQNAVKHGYKIFVITGGKCEEVRERLLEFGVTEVHLKAASKLEVYADIKARHNLGGKGCVRDVIEQTMRLHGNWFTEKGFQW